MESERFDQLVRETYDSASRRGVMRVGIGALAASALVTLGLRAEKAEAKQGKKKKKTVCHNGQTIRVKNRKKHLRHGDTKGPCTCPAGRPVTCGTGCCPAEYSLCCETVDDPILTHECAPASFTCCPVNQGGGACGGLEPVCCPPTAQTPEGWCAEVGADCCTTEEGGYSCPPGETCCPLPNGAELGWGPWCANPNAGEFCCPAAQGGGVCTDDAPVCCPGTQSDPTQYCCMEGSSCCDTDADCDGGAGVCDNGCCLLLGLSSTGNAGRTRANRSRGQRSGSERFHMRAS